MTVTAAHAERIAEARYVEPVERYGHFALGRPHEYARLVARNDAGRELNLTLPANAAPIGTPNRWLNPVGVADLDGDGVAEIAAVVTPHIGGVLAVYRRRGDLLEVVDRQAGYSNHVYGSPEFALSAAASPAGESVLLVPDPSRTWLRRVALRSGRLVETGGRAFAEPITGPEALRACLDGLTRQAGSPLH